MIDTRWAYLQAKGWLALAVLTLPVAVAVLAATVWAAPSWAQTISRWPAPRSQHLLAGNYLLRPPVNVVDGERYGDDAWCPCKY